MLAATERAEQLTSLRKMLSCIKSQNLQFILHVDLRRCQQTNLLKELNNLKPAQIQAIVGAMKTIKTGVLCPLRTQLSIGATY